MAKYIFLFVFISGLFWACEQDDAPGVRNDEPAEGAVPVNFKLQLNGTPDIETGTGYIPMTKAAGTIKTGLYKDYKYVLLKKIEDSWYIEAIGNSQLETTGPGYTPWWDIEIKGDGPIGDLAMELRPGTYKLAVFLNSRCVQWDNTVKPGDRVYTEGKAGERYPRICRYIYNTYAPGCVLLSRELFTGSANFIVEKNGDLHTEASGREPAVTLTRKVGQFQVLLKKTEGKGPNDYSFGNTQYFMRAVFRAQGDGVFCEGLDVTGMPYSDPQNPWKELRLYASEHAFSSKWRTDKAGRKYRMVELNSTDPAFFLFADPDKPEGVPYTVEIESLTGASGSYPYEGFHYEGEPLTGVLKNNSVSGIALECVEAQEYQVKIGVATDGNGQPLAPEDYLFSPYYLWNQDQDVTEVN
ncbi:MAG: hypothetical protein LIP00_11860 [Parabacteroides sp.]|nr:hypothetical protein [Parabacteroides sp.]